MDFQLTHKSIKEIEESTRRQSKNPNWHKFRKGRMTGSTFGPFMKMRSFTSNKGVFRSVCYPGSASFSTNATRHGCNHESDGLKAYAKLFSNHPNLKVMGHTFDDSKDLSMKLFYSFIRCSNFLSFI